MDEKVTYTATADFTELRRQLYALRKEAADKNVERIESFREIEPGWIDRDQGEKISEFAIERAKVFAKVLSASGPAISPLEDGGITLEWSNSFGHVSIDFYPEEERSPDLLHGDVFVMAPSER